MRLGRVNVEAMLRSLTAKQFLGWEHFAQLEPFEDSRWDWLVASIRQTIFNMSGRLSEKQKPISDFVLTWEPKKPQTWQEKKALLMAVGMAFSAKAKDIK